MPDARTTSSSLSASFQLAVHNSLQTTTISVDSQLQPYQDLIGVND